MTEDERKFEACMRVAEALLAEAIELSKEMGLGVAHERVKKAREVVEQVLVWFVGAHL